MKLRGEHKACKTDIMMYQGIASLADNKMQKLDEELIPTFIIEEALEYFCNLEKYEICSRIKKFFQTNTSFVVNITREEWFGPPVSEKKRKKA